MDRVQLEITGISDLLLHGANGLLKVEEQTAGAQTRQTRRQQSDLEIAEEGVYRGENRVICFPQAAFRQAFLEGLKGKVISPKPAGMQRAPSAKTWYERAVFVGDEWCILTDLQGTPLTTYGLDVRRAVNANTGGAIRAVRARLKNWKTVVTLLVDQLVLPVEGSAASLLHNMNCAGVWPGIGSYRIGRGGPFGRFKANLLSVESLDGLQVEEAA